MFFRIIITQVLDQNIQHREMSITITKEEKSSILHVASLGETSQLDNEIATIAEREEISKPQVMIRISDEDNMNILHRAAQTGATSQLLKENLFECI